MNDKIKLLPDPVANQIAAGEVVNRPASVVKEMMENAVDAGASNVTVNFRDGGKTYIQVIDNGAGMSVNDARLAFDRHATSKISDVEDIYSLSTFGFRGEALASIASVAEVELRTKPHDEQIGTKVEISGGKFISQEPVNCPAGSQFIIKNLFYNVPARRRFLDKSSTEGRHITAEYQRVALCNPEIAFTLYDSDSLVSKLPPSGLRQRIVGVIGKSIGKNLLEVNADTSIVKIEGFTGRPVSAKQNNKEQFLFVNGRYFKNPYFHKAIVSAYDKLIQANTQPSYFIYLTIDQSKIDVNVHPQKTEVKFSDGSDMWQIINAAIRETLAKSGVVPAMDFEMDTETQIPVFKDIPVYKMPGITANPEFNPFEKYKDGTDSDGHSNSGGQMTEGESRVGNGYYAAGYGETNTASKPTDGEDFADYNINRPWNTAVKDKPGYYDASGRPDGADGVSGSGCFGEPGDEYEKSILEYIGDEPEQGRFALEGGSGFNGVLQWGKRYFATAFEGSLAIIDIPRAYETILFDRYSIMLSNGSSVCQQLLFPHRIAMSLDDITVLKEHMDDFNSFGFEIVFSGEQSVELTGLPADLSGSQPEDLLYELLDTLRDEGCGVVEIKNRKIAAAMARIGAAAKTKTMTAEQLESLTQQLAECNNPSFTPFGKPVITLITDDEIRKRMS